MRISFYLIAGILHCCQKLGANIVQDDRDIPVMTVPEIIQYWGYPVEEHWVTTSDGYILGLHRIPHGRNDPNPGAPRPVAYMQHCLTCSSAIWSFGPPNKSLGYLLADAGYDVWMGNSRGNSYSRNHTFLEPCSMERCDEFWQFGWDEGGLYDVTAGIDFALNHTGQSDVFYFGHSMGCTQYFVMLSTLPEYNEKIRLGTLLAPPAYMSHAPNPIFQIASLAGDIQILYHLFGFAEFLPHYDFITWLGHLLCSDDHPLLQTVCMNMGFLFMGFNPGQLNGTMIPTYLDHIPEGTSTRPFVHYAQLYLSGKFEAYDYGEEGNLEHYGQSTPRDYDLKKVTAPTAIFKGDADDLADVIDIDLLVNELPNVVFDHLVEIDGWTHADYIVAMDADVLVYDYILDILKDYS